MERPRKLVLRKLVYEMTASLTGDFSGPVDLTAGCQTSNNTWWQLRKLLITASKIKMFNTEKTSEQISNLLEHNLWSDNDHIETVAMKYGICNEKNACLDYEAAFNVKISDVGLCVNSKYPGLGASPDSLVLDLSNNSHGLLEIKCPKILENLMPTELSKLSSRQRSSFCCKLVDENSMTLKKTHTYYYQVQTQMAITERTWCDFVIWTPKAFHTERILYDPTFIEPVLK